MINWFMKIIKQLYHSLMSFKAWLIELFKDERGNTSIKPVISFIGMLVLCSALIISLVSKREMEPSSMLIDAITIITCVGLGGDSLDKFSIKKNNNTNNNTQEPTN